MIGIYKITNPNNEVYIGGTRNFTRRSKEYRNGKTKEQRLMHESVQKFGWGRHIMNIIHELPVDVSQEVLDVYEQLYMDFYKDAGIVLLNLQGAGQRGKHCDETKKIMSASRIGIKYSDETKAKIGLAHAGKKISEEQKQKLREANLGKKYSDETKKKVSVATKGGNNPTAKKVINTETGIIYECVKYAAKEMGISYWRLQYYLNGKHPNKTTLKYL